MTCTIETPPGGPPANTLHTHRLSRLAGKTGGRDGTAYYYISKAAPTTFMAHHIQRISLAVNVKNAAGIARSLNGYFKKLAFGDNPGEAARV